MKRLTSFLLAMILFAGLLLVGVPVAHAASAMTVSDSMVDVLKQEEGFAEKPYWDYSQWTVGYGTKCPDDMVDYYTENGITEEAAEVMLRNYLSNTENTINRNFIDQYNLTLTQGQFDALVSFTYNCGSSWIYETTGTFHNAVKNGTTGSELIRAFSLWCTAGGQILPGLIRRRLSEANMYLNEQYSRNKPDHYCYVYYDANGGSVSYRIQGYDATLNTPPAYTATKSGDTFQGWYTALTGGSKVTVLTQDMSGMTLYARWGSPQQEEPVVPETNGVEVVVGSNYVNLRKGPGFDYDIVDTLNTGHKLTVTEVVEDTYYSWGNVGDKWICLPYTNYDEVTGEQEGGQGGTTQPTTVTGTVRAEGGLAVRNGPGTSYSVCKYLDDGASVTVTEQVSANGMTWGKTADGWICMNYVVLDGGNVQQTKMVIADCLYVRSGPGTDYEIVSYLYYGAYVTVYETTSVGNMLWGRISSGWVSMDYLQ